MKKIAVIVPQPAAGAAVTSQQEGLLDREKDNPSSSSNSASSQSVASISSVNSSVGNWTNTFKSFLSSLYFHNNNPPEMKVHRPIHESRHANESRHASESRSNSIGQKDLSVISTILPEDRYLVSDALLNGVSSLTTSLEERPDSLFSLYSSGKATKTTGEASSQNDLLAMSGLSMPPYKSILRKQSQFEVAVAVSSGVFSEKGAKERFVDECGEDDRVLGNYSRTLPAHLARRFGVCIPPTGLLGDSSSASTSASESEDDLGSLGFMTSAGGRVGNEFGEDSVHAVLQELLEIDPNTANREKPAALASGLAASASVQPVAAALKKPRVTFSPNVMIGMAIPATDYDRKCPSDMVAKCLTPELAYQIKKELNAMKKEMIVHEAAKSFTQFYTL